MAKGKFYDALSQRMLVINQSSAGAGFSGLLGLLGFLVIAIFFFVIENYFLSLLLMSFGLLFYVSGSDLSRIAISAFTIFFSNKHLVQRAAWMHDTLLALSDILKIQRNKKGEVVAEPLAKGTKITLPDNPLVHDLSRIIATESNTEYAHYIAHTYFEDCQELYEQSADNFDFVSQTMPLFGLIGTVLGLIAMFDTLGADIRVEALSPQLALALKTTLYGAIFSSLYRIIAARFEQRLKVLEHDYDAFIKAVDVLVQAKPEIEVAQ